MVILIFFPKIKIKFRIKRQTKNLLFQPLVWGIVARETESSPNDFAYKKVSLATSDQFFFLPRTVQRYHLEILNHFSFKYKKVFLYFQITMLNKIIFLSTVSVALAAPQVYLAYANVPRQFAYAQPLVVEAPATVPAPVVRKFTHTIFWL